MSLRTYLIKRIAIALFTIWLVASLNFVVFVLHPGDATKYARDPDMTDEQKEIIRREYGFFDPLHVRYLKYLKNLLSFGFLPPYFGISFTSHKYVMSDLSWKLPITVGLLGSALVGLILVGIPIGILAASKRGTKLDVMISGIGLFTYGLPSFFVQLFAMLFFVFYLNQAYGISLFPAGGWISYPSSKFLFAQLFDIAWHFALPVLTLVLCGFAGWALYTRNMLVDTLTQDYIQTARAKGLSERKVLFKHALRSIYPSIATFVALSIPTVVTGSIITEQVFGLEGIGQWFIRSISLGAPDYPVVEAILFIYAIITILCNLIADFMYGILDPRIRVGTRK